MNTLPHVSTAKKLQKGAAAVVTSVVLLLVASIAILYLNRSLIFEQRSSANYVRSTSALEAAEAGVEWAMGMMNTPYDIDTSCSFDTTTNTGFLGKYMLTNLVSSPSSVTASWVYPATTTFPGCKINGTTYTCSCPNVTTGSSTPPSLTATSLPGFVLSFALVNLTTTTTISGYSTTTDPQAVLVTSVGCTETTDTSWTETSRCSGDATATVRTIIKMRPLVSAVPPAPLSAGNNCDISNGTVSVTNTDVSSNGTTVNCGAAASVDTSKLTSVPGIPVQNTVVGYDSSLSSLYSADSTCSNSKIFSAYFKSTIEEYAASPKVYTSSCSTPSSCASDLDTAYANGWRSFYFKNDIQLSGNNTYGSQSQPVTIVSAGKFDVQGSTNIYGLLYANAATITKGYGTGTMNVYGAVVACGDFKATGSGSITYDPTVLMNTQDSSAILVRVPGSWRDW